MYYIAAMFADIMTEGNGYLDVHGAISVVSTNYQPFPGSDDYRYEFHWWEDRRRVLLTERRESIFLDLRRVRKEFESGKWKDWVSRR
ncbi:hypothetical protein [Heliophilum fasciatum]|uniref:Uncharacterized protein n=1 Tax=Heliophilum fasciatum TaxID=35700 RepID=A0A4R2RYZ4_9FIRM|nr:hypothetical protein [Heliophilum fasciatum]MCW2276785.1 hypothetical protein [Heliophilum fasciatum]TCP68754.1 hypothetical protein EDD73_102150 [Heliophilum fasciatum]